MRLVRIVTFSILGLFLPAPCLRCQETQVTASVGSDTVGVEDQFQFAITVSGENSGDAEEPRISNLKGFQIVQGPSISTQFQWINGRSSNSKSFIYILLPEKEGQFTIDPVEVHVGNKTYKTQPLHVRVTSAPRNPSPPSRSPLNPLSPFDDEYSQREKLEGDSVFIKADLDRSTAYPGQQVTVTYRLYTRVGISGIQLQENPPLTGFWVEDLEVEKNPKATAQVINGREYQVFTIKKQALFATTTGKLTVPSSIFAISARTGGDFFDVFGRTETLYRRTQEVHLDVKPLPLAGQPADFNNAVGSFKLSSSIDKTEVSTGEAVAFRVKLEGQGNLKMIPDIPVPPFPDFTVYSSKRSDSYKQYGEDLIGGKKTWEYALVPKAPGRQTIPSLSFSFFDPEQEKYKTVTTLPLSLHVVRGSDNAVSISGLSGSDKQNITRQGEDIHFIKLSAGNLENKDRHFYNNPWFYVIAFIPLAFNIVAFGYRRRQSRFAGDQDFARSQKAKRRALKQLKLAEKEGKSDARRFYDRAAAALSGYLADKFNMTEIQLTGDNLERTLSESLVQRETVEETRACLQECDFGRFVSASRSMDAMTELGSRIRKNIDALEKTGPAADAYQNREAGIRS